MANIKTTQSLAAKQALTVFVVSMLLGVIFSLRYTLVDVKNEKQRIAKHYRMTLMQNYNAASQAAYRLNPILAEQVIANLMADSAIKSARLIDDFGDTLFAKERLAPSYSHFNTWLTQYLVPDSTVFSTQLHQPQGHAVVGELRFTIHTGQITHTFIKKNYQWLLFDFLRTCLMTAILLAFFYFKLSRPITQLIDWVRELQHTKKALPNSLQQGHNELKELAQTFYVLWEEREHAVEQLNHLAYYDSLTQLKNRSMLMKILSQWLDSSIKNDTTGALFYLNLNRFKTINDSLGHTVGDKLLIAVGRRLEDWAHYNYTVARIGGDEFAILLPAYDTSKVEHIVHDLLAHLSRLYTIGSHQLYCTASIGITLFPDETVQSDIDVLRQADTALFRAKRSRQPYQFYLPEMQSQIAEFMDIEKGLHHAIEQGELELYYQPQVDKYHHIIGVEALVRWNHPTRGLLSPATFMPVAEETGQIIDIGHWILNTACQQYAQWHNDDVLPQYFRRLAINISPLQFAQESFVELVQSALETASVSSQNIELEITENLLLENIDGARDKMRQLKQLGIYFSIDDFGTGYSSLRYLKYLDINGLKIDRSFISNLHESSSAQAIVDTMVVIAQRLEIDVIAEGVENRDELDALLRMQCEHFQGYFFDKPLPEHTLRERFRQMVYPS
ncbi:EAL domain-containing protein [Vibrio zhugei]|uniref:EAL domain-containing protein n=1 Tax=Vibrio zhugei TaxID=2479546 RepID=A0ABV7C763_9VIBR|nr:bifunctional diguanylate cyclase/phosphodiesterase [Vibrio zhugei]